MIAETRRDFFQKLVALGLHYPDMRFGQLLCFACTMAEEGEPGRVEDVADSRVTQAIDRHLTTRYGERGCKLRNGLSSLTETRGALVDALGDLGNVFAGWNT